MNCSKLQGFKANNAIKGFYWREQQNRNGKSEFVKNDFFLMNLNLFAIIKNFTKQIS